MYTAIRQGKARAGKAEELARRVKEGAILEGGGSDRREGEGSDFENAGRNRGVEERMERPATAVAGPVIVHTLA